MKVILYLLSTLLLLTCGDQSKTILKIKTGIENNKVTWGDTLNLNLKKQSELTNVQYYLNDKPIEKNHVFTNEPLGIQTIKAIVTKNTETITTETTLTLLAVTPPKLYTYTVLNSYPHDISSYTQGLEFDGDLLYESTGLNGQSTLRTVEFDSGKVIKNKLLDKSYFGEGLTILENQVIQLTWKAMKGFVYNKTTLDLQKAFPYESSKEGWGLCNDGNFLYKSDGSNRIWILDPNTYKELRSIQVMTHKTALQNLNELEWVDGKIYANTYQFNKEVAVIIDPSSGTVEGVIDFTGLKKQVKQHPNLNVLNGIAFHKKRNTFFVTGKNWSKLFEVSIIPKNE
ncbi:MAG: glutamine cyclotransferase [Flavobacteriaceae bacterium]|jgi:glutamine cyclotransferase|tara:strand:+ start:82 stop:1104 length:1023 start_codon:yes stop_codon:yes gene_type:complete